MKFFQPVIEFKYRKRQISNQRTVLTKIFFTGFLGLNHVIKFFFENSPKKFSADFHSSDFDRFSCFFIQVCSDLHVNKAYEEF